MEKQHSHSDKVNSLDLVKGRFKQKEAIQLLSQMVDQKIRFLENSIHSGMLEEDIRHREKHIGELQNDWKMLREQLKSTDNASIDLNISATIRPTHT